MSLEAHTQKDLAPSPQDAQNVIGGKRVRHWKKPVKVAAKAKKAAPKTVAATSVRVTFVSAPATAVEETIEATDDCQ